MSWPKHYMLVGKIPIACADYLEWVLWFQSAWEQRRVAVTHVGEAEISTVFLGLDHRFAGDGPPLLFETMVFVGTRADDEILRRYCTWEEAERGHAETVAEMDRIHKSVAKWVTFLNRMAGSEGGNDG